MARSRGNQETNERPTWASTRTGEKKAKWTTLIIIDSQVVKNTCNASVESKGFCVYKATNGIKRHLAVDMGFPFLSHCTKANVSDDRRLIEMLSDNIDYFKFKPVNIPKITILHRRRISPQKTRGTIENSLSSNHELLLGLSYRPNRPLNKRNRKETRALSPSKPDG